MKYLQIRIVAIGYRDTTTIDIMTLLISTSLIMTILITIKTGDITNNGIALTLINTSFHTCLYPLL